MALLRTIESFVVHQAVKQAHRDLITEDPDVEKITAEVGKGPGIAQQINEYTKNQGQLVIYAQYTGGFVYLAHPSNSGSIIGFDTGQKNVAALTLFDKDTAANVPQADLCVKIASLDKQGYPNGKYVFAGNSVYQVVPDVDQEVHYPQAPNEVMPRVLFVKKHPQKLSLHIATIALHAIYENRKHIQQQRNIG